MLTHQQRSLPSGPPIPGARLNRTYSISSQGQIENAARKGHRGSSPAIRTFTPDGQTASESPPESPPLTYTGSRSPSPLHIRAASLEISRTGSPSSSSPYLGTSPQGESHSPTSLSVDAGSSASIPYKPMSANSLCVRRASRCLSPLLIPPMSPSPKSPSSLTGDGPSSSGPVTGPLSPSLGSLQLDLYQKRDICIFLDASKQPSGYRSPGNNKNAPADPADVVTFNAHHNVHLGKLHFGIKYDLDKSDLHVHVIEARDLPGADQSGFNDPYIRVFLLPEVDARKRESNVHPNEGNPVFDEHFKFPVSQEDLEEKIITLQVLDKDKYSRNDIVGQVSMRLEDYNVTTNLDVWAEIVQSRKPSGEKQEILISLSYLPSAERLTVVLLKARNLHPPPNKDTIDPFVKVYLLGGGKRQRKKKTTARKNSKSPNWNEAVTFSISSTALPTASIEICVLDQSYDLMGRRSLIGACMIGPHQNGSELSHWQEMNQNFRQTITMWHVLT